jgi:hypothetical protein
VKSNSGRASARGRALPRSRSRAAAQTRSSGKLVRSASCWPSSGELDAPGAQLERDAPRGRTTVRDGGLQRSVRCAADRQASGIVRGRNSKFASVLARSAVTSSSRARVSQHNRSSLRGNTWAERVLRRADRDDAAGTGATADRRALGARAGAPRRGAGRRLRGPGSGCVARLAAGPGATARLAALARAGVAPQRGECSARDTSTRGARSARGAELSHARGARCSGSHGRTGAARATRPRLRQKTRRLDRLGE